MIPHELPFTTSNTVVKTFRHAISLDERRSKFKANLWNRPQKNEEFLSISDQKIAEEAASGPDHGNTPQQLEEIPVYAKSRATPTDVDEVKKTFILFY